MGGQGEMRVTKRSVRILMSHFRGQFALDSPATVGFNSLVKIAHIKNKSTYKKYYFEILELLFYRIIHNLLSTES